MPLTQLKYVERLNHLAINVYGWEDGGVVILRLSRQEVDRRINLFFATKGMQHHYTWIKDLNRLLNQQSKNAHRLHFCERCLHGFTREDLPEKHKLHCQGINHAAVAIEMPKPGTDQAKTRFRNYHKQHNPKD